MAPVPFAHDALHPRDVGHVLLHVRRHGRRRPLLVGRTSARSTRRALLVKHYGRPPTRCTCSSSDARRAFRRGLSVSDVRTAVVRHRPLRSRSHDCPGLTRRPAQASTSGQQSRRSSPRGKGGDTCARNEGEVRSSRRRSMSTLSGTTSTSSSGIVRGGDKRRPRESATGALSSRLFCTVSLDAKPSSRGVRNDGERDKDKRTETGANYVHGTEEHRRM